MYFLVVSSFKVQFRFHVFTESLLCEYYICKEEIVAVPNIGLAAAEFPLLDKVLQFCYS